MATGEGGGGVRGGSIGGSEGVNGELGDGRGGTRGGQGDGSGLDHNRQRGFAQVRNMVNRFEAPSMNEIRARQEAVVANFLTFFQRKNTLVVELYRHCFYKSKPNKEKLPSLFIKICVLCLI